VKEDYLKEKKLKVVISPILACRLCNKGYPILKIKQKRSGDSGSKTNETVFLFEETEEFLKDFYTIMKEL